MKLHTAYRLRCVEASGIDARSGYGEYRRETRVGLAPRRSQVPVHPSFASLVMRVFCRTYGIPGAQGRETKNPLGTGSNDRSVRPR